MSQKIIINLLNKNDYLQNPMEIGLDDEWTSKSRKFDQRMKGRGVYILHVSTIPSRILYVGKTRGLSMDYATRLYRHATKAASSNSRIYQALKRIKQETGCPILVSLVTIEQIRNFFEGMKLEDAAMIDIYEQVLIHMLKPELQK